MQTDAAHLSGMLDFLGELSTSISAKVRQFDLTKSRVVACLEKVENVLELKTCIDGVQQALNNEDFEQAAAHIHRFCKLDDATIRAAQFGETDGTADGSATQLEGALQSLKESANKLKQIVREQFSEAVAAHDTASVERFFKIFPLIGLDQEGLESFAKYLAETVRRRCDEILKNCRRELASTQQRRGENVSGEKRFAFTEKNAVYFADLSNQLLEFVARLVDAHEPLIETYYGAGHLLVVVRHVQTECDSQMRCLLDAFRAARDTHRLVTDVRACTATQSSERHDDLAQKHAVEAKQLDAVISELALILAQISLFVKCIQRKLTNDLLMVSASKPDAEDEHAASARLRPVGAFVNNEMRLAAEQQLLVGDYLLLEEYYLRESIRKAFALERSAASAAATTADGRAVTSVVDDCFFIAKKCVRRALSSGSVDALCGMLNQLCSLLETDYVHLHYHRLRAGFSAPSNFFDEPERDSKLTQQQRAYIAAFNSLELSNEYLAALKAKLQDEVTSIHTPSHSNANARQKVETCMAQLDTLKNHISEAQAFGVEQLLLGVVKRELKRMLAPFESTSYTPNEPDAREDDYDADTAGWLHELSGRMSLLLRFFRAQLTAGNFDLLVDAAVAELQQRMERALLRKTVSRTGGFRFATDVRALVTFFTQQTNWSVRDRFARLSQVAVLLDLERVDEVLEYTKMSHDASMSDSRASAWRLSPAETRQFLTLRTDFRIEEITRLPL